MMRRQNGFSIVEVLVAMGILGIVSVGFLTALTNSSQAAMHADRMDSGRVIAQAQMEWVKSQAFLTSGAYSANDDIMTEFPGYTVSIAASAAAQRDAFIQKITITVFHDGIECTTLQDCKVKK